MAALGINCFLLSGCLSLLVSSGSVVPTTDETQTRLTFEDVSKVGQDATRRDSDPLPIQNHTPGLEIGRTSAPESSDPIFNSSSRSLISTPAEPPEASKSTIQATLMATQSQRAAAYTSPANWDLSSWTTTPEAPRTSSISGSKGNSTPVHSPETSRGPAPTGSLKPEDLSDRRSPLSSPETSTSVPDSTPTLIQGHTILSALNTSLTGKVNLTNSISTPEAPRATIWSTPVPIQSHKSTAVTSWTSNSNSTRLVSTADPPQSTRSGSESTSIPTQSHRPPPGFGTTQTREAPGLASWPPVTSPPAFGTTVRTDQPGAPTATRSPSSTSAVTSSSQTTTRAPCVSPKDPPVSENQSCSPRGVVKPCLVAIACLAALATIFMVSTIVLCAKLSTRNYKPRKAQDQTEMTFMSSLLPERNYEGVRRQRSPVSNGVLVLHSAGGDSDDGMDDNLTLSSFLPEGDRCV
ncbi:P-selectin glycoprotein ligand 1 [Syngnathus scovelli]|uniref:P-selectin glycoprotein ligand 1 n=1 Tax=Syngnathus scovelli TaxID=161590 RepID=UPI0021105D89|nr:P-selectin glycoprotein ligand 1 [Syngnathus scovelli]